RVGSWNTKPIRPDGIGLPGSPRLTRQVPRVGSLSPAMIRSNVLLPQPDGPRRLRNSPRATLSSIPSSASSPEANRLPTPCSWTIGSVPADPTTSGRERFGGVGSGKPLTLSLSPLAGRGDATETACKSVVGDSRGAPRLSLSLRAGRGPG